MSGIVQGVGFRPHVYRLAVERGLTGRVWNDPGGATVQVYGPEPSLSDFVSALRNQPPPLARIDAIVESPLDGAIPAEFSIVESQTDQERVCLVSPDVATCDDCIAELFDPADRRFQYPYINCTNCGPRFTIVRDLPYDRPKTTMADYPLCDYCQAQYEDPLDRRFHAQPVACPVCGPSVSLGDVHGIDAISAAASLLREGKIVAVKGLGGYHLACDASSEDAVRRLRQRKCREEKPLAVMVASAEVASRYVRLTPRELALLTSLARPIVLADRIQSQFPRFARDDKPAVCSSAADESTRSFEQSPQTGVVPSDSEGPGYETSEGAALAESIAPGNPRLGVMLAYTPLQHLLFAQGAPEALVMTSGNRSEEPIAYTEEQAFERLAGIADAFLIGEREIHTRCDDSVVQVVAGETQFLRRSRGYVPLPIDLPFDAQGILAVGGELKNTFAIGRKTHAFVGHHIGDLKNVEEYDAFRTGVEQLQALVEVEPTLVARDLHPMYLSSGYADRLGLPVETVQHHHAHVASVMAEHRLENQRVIGVAFDGTGYGEDGLTWGAEFLLADYAGFERAAHFRYLPLPGGDAAIKQNWRSASAYLLRFLPASEIDAVLRGATDDATLRAVIRMVQQDVNCAPASSAGRLFDAVTSVLGIRYRDSFEGQGAMELEALAYRGKAEACYTFLSDGNVLDPTPVVEAVVTDMRSGVSPADIAARFHASLAECIVQTCLRLADATDIQSVCLSGGTFQNRLLSEWTIAGLRELGLTVLTNRLVPPNDGGISLGQLAVAAYRRNLCA